MSRAEREKGARGEREVAAIFRGYGFDCDRTPNSGGLRLKGDLYGDVPFHVEVKRHEVARLWEWRAQAISEAAHPALWVVAFRRNGVPWLGMAPLDTMAGLLADHSRVVADARAMSESVTDRGRKVGGSDE